MAAQQAPLPNLYQQSVTFAGALQALLEIIEDVDLNDGQYLTACNALKFLHDNKTTLVNNIIQNPVVIEHFTRARRPQRRSEAILSDDEKLRSGHYCRCRKCDRIIQRGDYNMKSHQERMVCRTIYSSKKMSVNFNSTDIVNYMLVIGKIQSWGLRTGREWAWR